jgi:hypothetical protein
MRFEKKILISIFAGFITLILLMVFNITPCQRAPNIPNPQLSWSSCSLNPDTIFEGRRIFLGYTESLFETYILVLIVVAIITFIIVSYFTKTRKIKN